MCIRDSHSTLNINKSFAMSTFRTQHAPSMQDLIYLHEASKEGCRFFCIKANFICNTFDKSILDENMFYNECNISHQCDCPRQLTYFIEFQKRKGRGAKRNRERGKEGSSKTGSYMSRRIHVSSMTVDTTITLSPHDTIQSCCPPAVADLVHTNWYTGRSGSWQGLLDRSPKYVTSPPGMAHGTESMSPNRSPHLCRRFPRRQTPHLRYGDTDT